YIPHAMGNEVNMVGFRKKRYILLIRRGCNFGSQSLSLSFDCLKSNQCEVDIPQNSYAFRGLAPN
ncbi:MAG: hypothetical protein WBB47_14780, partial [Paenisporosarcina sp.]